MNLLEHEGLRWKHFSGEAQFDHPISYWGAVLDAREDGHVDLLYRWDPHSACHLHRHTAAVSSRGWRRTAGCSITRRWNRS